MVKRQTVWLSAMMVLSLMLIGYYTINGNVKEVTLPGDTPDAGVTTTDATPTATAQKNPPATDTATAKYLAELQLMHAKVLSEQEAQLQAVISNEKSTTDQVEQANVKLQKLQTLSEKEQQLPILLKGAGYANSAIVNDDGVNVTVAVESANLTPGAAVRVMKITSDQLGVDMDHVVVKHYG